MSTEAVTFPTRQTRGDLIWYFARHYFFDMWMPWIASFITPMLYAAWAWYAGTPGLVALLSGLVIGVGMLLAMFLLATLLYALRVWRMDPEGLILGPKEARFDAAGVHVTGPSSEAQFGWDQVAWIQPKGRFLFVRLTDGELQLLFPLRDLSPGAVADIQALHAAADESAV